MLLVFQEVKESEYLKMSGVHRPPSSVLFPRDFSEMRPVYNRAARTLPRVGPELGGRTVGGQLVRALKSHYSLGVAEGDELVRPDACAGLAIVD